MLEKRCLQAIEKFYTGETMKEQKLYPPIQAGRLVIKGIAALSLL